jgi:hypothetical protein
LEGSGSNLIFRYYPGMSLEVLRKSTNNLSQDGLSPYRDLNPEPPEYEAGVLTTRPRRLIRRWKNCVKMYLKEIGCENVDLIHSGQDRD